MLSLGRSPSRLIVQLRPSRAQLTANNMSTSVVLPCLRITGIPPEPPEQEEHIGIIEFCHPGYKYPHNILFRLPALDRRDGRAGVHHETARLACCILAGNVWEGWLTANEPDGPRVEIHDSEAVLMDKRYFFHCPPGSTAPDLLYIGTQYPIVRNFESWLFPRDNLPPYWQDLVIPEISASAKMPPVRCAVSGRFLPLETAHLIPVSQRPWFDKNMMGSFQHTTGTSRTRWINQPPNTLYLTKDIHHLLDQSGHVAFIPRRINADAARTVGIHTYIPQMASSDSASMALVCHVLRPSPANEVGRTYHLRSLEPMQGILPEYLFASFALKICNLCIFFQDDGVRRHCFELNVDATDGSMSHTVQTATFQPASRSPTMRRDSSQASSNKRARSTHDDDEGDGHDGEFGRTETEAGSTWWYDNGLFFSRCPSRLLQWAKHLYLSRSRISRRHIAGRQPVRDATLYAPTATIANAVSVANSAVELLEPMPRDLILPLFSPLLFSYHSPTVAASGRAIKKAHKYGSILV